MSDEAGADDGGVRSEIDQDQLRRRPPQRGRRVHWESAVTRTLSNACLRKGPVP